MRLEKANSRERIRRKRRLHVVKGRRWIAAVHSAIVQRELRRGVRGPQLKRSGGDGLLDPLGSGGRLLGSS